MPLYLSEDQIDALLTPGDAVAAVEGSFERLAAGRGSDTLPAAQGLYLPLVGLERSVGVLGIFPKEQLWATDPEPMHLLEMLVNQTALAVEGTELGMAALRAADEVEKERVHNLLLSTFTYELPGPLSEISRAAEQLLKPEVFGDESKKIALIKQIQEKAQELNKLAAELPKIIESKSE